MKYSIGFRTSVLRKVLPPESRSVYEHLNLWEQELTQLMTNKQEDLKAENKALKKQNKELERELTRKEKALAEVVALLTLKKKLALPGFLWVKILRYCNLISCKTSSCTQNCWGFGLRGASQALKSA